MPGGGTQGPAGGADPFTGAGRYIPASNQNGTTGSTGTPHGADPFTGKDIIYCGRIVLKFSYDFAQVLVAEIHF